MERFQWAVDAKARLLKVETLGRGSGTFALGFLLTFDVGRLLVRLEEATGQVHSVHLETQEGLLEEVVDTCEQDPWWAVLGNPIVRVWRPEGGVAGTTGLRIQFREDDHNPKIIALIPEGTGVRVFVDRIGGESR
jgi:hypothetical protein